MVPAVTSEIIATGAQINKLTRIARLNLGEGGKSVRSSDGNAIRKDDPGSTDLYITADRDKAKV